MVTFTNYYGYTITVTPSAMKWSLQDVSAADSGRDASGTMIKNRVAQKRKLEFEFNGWDWQQVSNLLKIVSGVNFDGSLLPNNTGDYFSVTYPDMLTGTMETRTFYVGDRECPVYVWWDDKKILSQVTFNCIER